MNLGALLAIGLASQDHRRVDREPIEINPLTGKQPIGNPSSNRKATLLEKARRRAARQEPTQ